MRLEEPWAKDFRTYVVQSGNEGGRRQGSFRH
jgi:hypothetical protein